MIREATSADSEKIVEIYNYYILNSIATFAETENTADEMSARILSVLQNQLPWLVAEQEGEIVGYAYASKWRGRCAYRYSVESTIYLNHQHQAKGWGSKLYEELLKELRTRNLHVVISGISLPNQSSISLHEKFGFEKVAHFSEVGYKFNQWVDVGYWQLKLKD